MLKTTGTPATGWMPTTEGAPTTVQALETEGM